MRGVDRTNKHVFVVVMRGVIVPPSKLIVTNMFSPKGEFIIRGGIIKGGNCYVMLCYAMLYYTILYYIILINVTILHYIMKHWISPSGKLFFLKQYKTTHNTNNASMRVFSSGNVVGEIICKSSYG